MGFSLSLLEYFFRFSLCSTACCVNVSAASAYLRILTLRVRCLDSPVSFPLSPLCLTRFFHSKQDDLLSYFLPESSGTLSLLPLFLPLTTDPHTSHLTSSPPLASSDFSHALQFDQDGYLILPSFFSQSQAQSLLSRSHQLLSSFSLSDHPMTQFIGGGGGDAKEGKVSSLVLPCTSQKEITS